MEQSTMRGFRETQQRIDGQLSGLEHELGTYGDGLDRRFNEDTMSRLFKYRSMMGDEDLKEKKTIMAFIKSNRRALDDSERSQTDQLNRVDGEVDNLARKRRAMKSFISSQR